MSNKKVSPELQSFLVDFGLTDKEVSLYLALLKTGPNTIMNLARETGIKRSTTHNNVEELIKKGLVSQTNYGERRMVVAEDPEKLKFLVEQKKWNVKKLEESLPDVVGLINQMVPEGKENSKVEVKYYEGKEGVQLIYKEALASKELRSYANLGQITSVLPDNAKLFEEAQKNNSNLIIKEIVDESEVTKQFAQQFAKNSRYAFKVHRGEIKFTAIDTLIYDNHVAIIHLKDKLTGVVINNIDYYENTKTIFDFVWSIL